MMLPMIRTAIEMIRFATTCTIRRLARIVQPGASVTRSRWKTPSSRSWATVSAYPNRLEENTPYVMASAKNATYGAYCRSGNRSGTALEQMTAAGFTHVYDLAGGIGAWQNMGGPMTMG
jgi:rhodanese-related sulfurtransferase